MRRDKRKKEKAKKKKKGIFGKVVLFLLLILLTGLGAYLGYSITKNGGGLQGLLATALGQDIEQLEEVDPINILVLRS